VEYRWERAKAGLNRRKHGVDFRDAIGALEDPNRLETVDTRVEYGEARTQVIGMCRGNILFVVTASPREGICRIISARKATRDEQDHYYAGDRETW
jgi:uncharacterized protein